MNTYLLYYLAAVGALCVIWFAIDAVEDHTSAKLPDLAFELFMCVLIFLAIPVIVVWRLVSILGSIVRRIAGLK